MQPISPSPTPFIPARWLAVFCATLVGAVLGASAGVAGSAGTTLAQPDAPRVLATRLEPIVDRYLFDRLDGADLRLAQPRDEGEVLRFDAPWEGQFCNYVSIVKDGPRYAMYYRGWREQKGTKKLGGAVTCYAESPDGIRWTKPALGLHEFNGSKANNIVMPADERQVSTNFAVFLDERPGVPRAERFKGIGGVKTHGLFRFVSEDGVHWRAFVAEPIFAGYALDSENVALWSPAEQVYAIYLRTFTTGAQPKDRVRTISRSTSKDFVTWTTPVPMDLGNTPPEHLYTNATTAYFRAPHILVALPARFLPQRQVLSTPELTALAAHPSQHRGVSDAVFMTSRGGDYYDRTFMESFIRPGRRRAAWVARNNYPALGVVPTGDGEMSIYTVVNYATPGTHLRRYSLRVDGFASLHAGYSGGTALTWPLQFTGQKLVLNYATSAAGSLAVEVLDATGAVVPGYAAGSCDQIVGDEIARTVTWKGDGNLEKMVGATVRLRFVLKDADLYSLQFQP